MYNCISIYIMHSYRFKIYFFTINSYNFLENNWMKNSIQIASNNFINCHFIVIIGQLYFQTSLKCQLSNAIKEIYINYPFSHCFIYEHFWVRKVSGHLYNSKNCKIFFIFLQFLLYLMIFPTYEAHLALFILKNHQILQKVGRK